MSGVNAFLSVYRREMLSFWVTPLAWVLLVVFLLLQGIIFYSIVAHFANWTEPTFNQGPLQAYFGQDSIFLLMTLLLICPALTMRSFAEERRNGTIETLLTAPITPHSVVLAKYAAIVSTYTLIWLPTLLYVVILKKADTIDWGVVASSYLGLFAVGAAYLSLGILMSTLTQSQLVALLLTIGLQFGMFILGVGEYIFESGTLQDLCAYISIAGQMEEFSKGIVDLRRLVFDISLVTLGLFFSSRVVDSWRCD